MSIYLWFHPLSSNKSSIDSQSGLSILGLDYEYSQYQVHSDYSVYEWNLLLIPIIFYSMNHHLYSIRILWYSSTDHNKFYYKYQFMSHYHIGS